MSAGEVKVPGHPGIFRRGNGYVTRVHGKRISGRTIAEVKRRAAARRTDIARGEYRHESAATFADLARRWIVGYRGRSGKQIRVQTKKDYARCLGVTVSGGIAKRDGQRIGAVAHFGHMRISAIAPSDIKKYIIKLANEGLAPATVKQYLAPISAMYSDLVEEGIVRSNPCTHVRVPRPELLDDDDHRARALSDDELDQLIAAVPDDWRRLMVVLLSETGVRIGECIALTWADVDLGEQRLSVRRRLYRRQLAPPKSRYGRRTIPLSDHVSKALWRHRAGAGDDMLVFPNSDGGHLDPANLHARWYKPAARAAGVGWAGFHTLRHTCATNLLKQGLNAKVVQIWLGHHSPAFTLSVYTHLLSDDLPPSPFTAPRGNPVGTRVTETHRDDESSGAAETG